MRAGSFVHGYKLFFDEREFSYIYITKNELNKYL